MSIVNHLPCSSMVGEPFADFLNVSVPLDSAGGLRDSILSILFPTSNDVASSEFLHFSQLHASEQSTPALKQSQYNFKQKERLQLHRLVLGT